MKLVAWLKALRDAARSNYNRELGADAPPHNSPYVGLVTEYPYVFDSR
jgi:hypothetical protein